VSKYGYFKKKRKAVRAAFACLFKVLDKVMSRECLENRDDSKVLADLELLREKADGLYNLDDEVKDFELRGDARVKELDKEIRSADEYASNLYVQKWLSAAIKMEDDGSSVSNASKRKFK
jgi:hypothetical protein